MRLRLGLGERLGPFWAGVTFNPHRYFEQRPESDNIFDSRLFVGGCFFAFALVGTVTVIAVGLFVAFLVLLL